MRQTKILLFSLLMLCFMAGTAAADVSNSWMPDQYKFFQKMPENGWQDRIYLELPEGMVLASKQYNPSLGLFSIVIDTEKTNWESVILDAYQSNTQQIHMRVGIKAPFGASSQSSTIYFVDQQSPENTLKNNLTNANSNNGDAIHSQWIGEYRKDQSTFIPERPGWNRSVAVIWYDASGNQIGGEFLAFTASYTSGDAFTVEIPKVPNGDILPNAKNHTGVTASKSGNAVRYQVDKRYSGAHVYTAVAVPDIADKAAWTCHIGSSACTMEDITYPDGITRRSALIAQPLDTGDNIVAKTYTLEWRDAGGNMQYVSQFSSLMFFEGLEPWPKYVVNQNGNNIWTPVPASRMKLTYQNPIKSGTSMDYDENKGVAYFHVDSEKLPESADYARAQMQLTITPPAGAAAYQMAKGNGSKAFGPSNSSETYIRNQFAKNDCYAVGENLTIIQPLFDSHPKKGEEITLYKSAMILGEFSAEYRVINWYASIDDVKNGVEPLMTEYVFLRMDDCLLQQISDPYTSEDAALKEKFTAPVVVIPNENANKEMYFIAEVYPVDIDNARYYELRLVDKNGKAANLPAKAKIMMRYPEGTSFDNFNIVFNMRHLNNKYKTFETFSVEQGNLHLEEDYLWFTPSSLSPFILEWKTVEADLPKTGDSSWPLTLSALFGAVSIALFMQLNRRRI